MQRRFCRQRCCAHAKRVQPKQTEERLMPSPKTHPRSPTRLSRRHVVGAGTASMAAILLSGRAPLYAQTPVKKLDFANILGAPDVGGVAMEHFAKEVTARAKGELEVVFHGGTLLTKEMEIMNAVKSSNVATGSPAGHAARGSAARQALLPPCSRRWACCWCLISSRTTPRPTPS